MDPEIIATFKIDLDQVFPQEELVEQSKASAFEHFKTALWGACGVDSEGHPIELGMIAGALSMKRISASRSSPRMSYSLPQHCLLKKKYSSAHFRRPFQPRRK
jgi:hypothetical protein